MKVSDMDEDDTSFHAPEIPTAGTWLGIVGGAIAIVLACALWTCGTENPPCRSPKQADTLRRALPTSGQHGGIHGEVRYRRFGPQGRGPAAADRRRTLHRRHQAQRAGGARLRAALAACPCRHQEASTPRPRSKAPGVLLVFTGEDVKKAGFGDVPCLVPLENRDGTPRGETPRPMLAKDRVRHVGDPVALVVAETLEQAKDAAELIEVDYAAAAAHRRHLRVGPARRAAGARPHQGQHRLRLGDGRPRHDRRRLRQGRHASSSCRSSTSGWS